MIRLSESIRAWNTPEFKNVLKHELERLDVSTLPLQQGLSHSSYASDSGFQVMIIGVGEEPELIRAKAGIFYGGIIPGCGCNDDPTLLSDYAEYCEVQLDISKATGETRIALLAQ